MTRVTTWTNRMLMATKVSSPWSTSTCPSRTCSCATGGTIAVEEDSDTRIVDGSRDDDVVRLNDSDDRSPDPEDDDSVEIVLRSDKFVLPREEGGGGNCRGGRVGGGGITSGCCSTREGTNCGGGAIRGDGPRVTSGRACCCGGGGVGDDFGAAKFASSVSTMSCKTWKSDGTSGDLRYSRRSEPLKTGASSCR